ncbi:hypothetical protein [Burkholderia sp. A9]|nr:hypothetical protein [Burkholderia sp. A9]
MSGVLVTPASLGVQELIETGETASIDNRIASILPKIALIV